MEIPQTQFSGRSRIVKGAVIATLITAAIIIFIYAAVMKQSPPPVLPEVRPPAPEILSEQDKMKVLDELSSQSASLPQLSEQEKLDILNKLSK